ncbi:alcohol dehydrogenase [Croceicoccus estronivorus]|nr:alcohol dehydrogenase [Croceicoccus estronivorus]
MRIFFVCAAAMAMAACSGEPSNSIDVFPGVDATEASGDDWPDYDGPGTAHYSPLDQIDTGNIAKLGLVSFTDIETPGNSFTNPIEVGGTIYFAAGLSVVHAVDAVTGEMKWQYDPDVAAVAGDKMKTAWGSRGLAYANGQIFVGTLDGRLIALDAATGNVAWTAQTTEADDKRYITGAPWVFKDKVVIGHGGADFAPTRGYVTAYDQKTGKQAWRFYTVPGNPEDGFESKAMEMAAKTWTGEWWQYGGGATVWNAMAYDPELDRLYIGTGNGSPWNRKIRSPGGGDNLFVCSIVALNPDTGEYIWHYQTNPGETWDYNSAMDIELATMKIDGEMRPVILHAPKNGFFYVLDRRDGKLISAEPIVPVNWAERIDQKTGRPVENPQARFPDGKAAIVYPSPYGAHNVEAMSINPRTGLVYIPAMDQGRVYVDPPNLDDFHYNPEPIIRNNGIGTPPPDLTPKTPSSFLLAWNPATQKEAWRVPYPTIRGGGGTLSTAGGLLFQGRATGEFKALDARTGKELWSFDAQTAVMTNPITYRIDGKQYVSVIVGARFPTGLGLEREWDYRTQHWRLLTFALDGDAALPPADTEVLPFADDPAITIDADKAKAGAVLFGQKCALCHGGNAVSGGAAPDLRRSMIPHDGAIFAQVVREGLLLSRAMPKFDDLSPAETAEIREYLLQRARESARAEKPQNGMSDAGQ